MQAPIGVALRELGTIARRKDGKGARYRCCSAGESPHFWLPFHRRLNTLTLKHNDSLGGLGHRGCIRKGDCCTTHSRLPASRYGRRDRYCQKISVHRQFKVHPTLRDVCQFTSAATSEISDKLFNRTENTLQLLRVQSPSRRILRTCTCGICLVADAASSSFPLSGCSEARVAQIS